MSELVPLSVLRVYLGESDRAGGMAAYEYLVREAHARGLKGASVFRGASGYGANSRIHTAKLLRLSEDLPMVVEILDAPERIEAFINEVVDRLDKGALAVFGVMGRVSAPGSKT